MDSWIIHEESGFILVVNDEFNPKSWDMDVFKPPIFVIFEAPCNQPGILSETWTKCENNICFLFLFVNRG